MHMSNDDYAYIKYPLETAPDVAEYSRMQRDVFARAEHAFAVGPLLFERLREIRPANAVGDTMLVPGLLEKSPLLESGRLRAITFGRFQTSDAVVKQAPLAVAAFARAVRAGFQSQRRELEDAALTVVGAPLDAARQLRELAEQEAGRVINVSVLPYIEDRGKLKDLLSNSNLCIMPSWHEGFGLTAWEAIGAGVPLIVSRNSGVFRLLDKIGGAAAGCVRGLDVRGRGDGSPNAADVDAAASLILGVASDIPKARANAESLRVRLRFQCMFTWDATAATMCSALRIPVVESMLPGNQVPHNVSLVESPDVMEGLDIAASQRVLELAQGYYHNGQYDDALSALGTLKEQRDRLQFPVSLAIDATILECEVLLRVNDYNKAKALLSSASREASERNDWTRYIRLRSIENVILRDLGRYDEAVALARELFRLATLESHGELESAHRKLGRSLALAGRWDEAVKHGEAALSQAKLRQDLEGEAKALLVVGEAYRHGLNQAEAINAYVRGRDLSGRAGNVDCFLWCMLGLADSLFLLEKRSETSRVLEAIKRYMEKASQPHPLESLHLRLSELTVRRANGEDVALELEQTVAQYDRFDIGWPREYASQIQSADYSHPKRF
jgi:tetratricopeptide (TPR) repeat protein